MTRMSLQDNWTLTVLGENVYHIPETPIETKVPSTVYGTLLSKGLIPDPYFRDNELMATKLMENDFAYETESRRKIENPTGCSFASTASTHLPTFI